MLRSNTFVIVCCGLLATGGCQSSQDAQASFPAGMLQGTVHLFDNANDTVHHAVTVWIPALGVSTVSDTFGHWSLANVPFGTHDVYATSAGYDTLIFFDVVASGGTTYTGLGSLGPSPSNPVRITSVVWGSSPSANWPLMIAGWIAPKDFMTFGGFACFIDTALGIPAKGSHLLGPFQWSGVTNDSLWNVPVGMSALGSMHIQHGMKLYVTVCAANNVSTIVELSGYTVAGCTFNSNTSKLQVVSAGPLTQPYETAFPW